MFIPEEPILPEEAFVPGERSSKYPPRKCANPSCGKEFIPLTKRKLYCSGSCNAQASKIRFAQTAMNNNDSIPMAPVTENKKPEQPAVNINSLSGIYAIPPHAQMMIDHYKAEVARWENKYDKELEDHRDTKKKLDDLKEEIKQEEGGMAGFAEKNPELAGKLVDFGQFLAGKLFDKIPAGPGAAIPAEVAATMAGLDEGTATKVMQFRDWFVSLNPESQKNVWDLLDHFASVGKSDQEKMNYVILNIIQTAPQWR